MHSFLLLASLCAIYISSEHCDELGVLLYEDLGCTPQITDDNPCPTHFECEDFTTSSEACRFHSINISLGENLEDNLIYSASACKIGCKCILPDNLNVAEFSCATKECPEEVETVDELKTDCYRTYDVGECCASGTKCPPFSSTKCLVDGKEYRDGEQFFPSTECESCVCQQGFKNRFETPFCKRMVCAEQTFSYRQVVEYCAPVYLRGKTALCCPEEWICPSDSDKMEPLRAESNSNHSDLECKWGKELFKLGNGFKTTFAQEGQVTDVTCKCVLPPFLTCKENNKWQNHSTATENGKAIQGGATPLRPGIVIAIIIMLAIMTSVNLY